MGEIESYRGTVFTDEPIETIYIGGGTPSLLTINQVEAILEKVKTVFEPDLKEVTLEMNPDDVTANYLSGLKHAGITRASMGVQTFQPKLLTFMNRAHTRDEALQSLELLNNAAFNSYTVDLIYGNPEETVDQFLEDLDQLLAFSPPHISAYSLTVEPKTRLGKQVELGRIVPAEDDKVAEQFKALNDRLPEDNIERYEVSNYSRPGAEAVHNSNYWNHQNYLGLGPGAHSFWWHEQMAAGRKQPPQRWQNEPSLKNYPAKTEPEHLTMQQLAEERIMMGLRTRQGITVKELENRYYYELNERQISYLSQKEKEDKLVFNDSIRLTEIGIIIADAIILDLVTLAGS